MKTAHISVAIFLKTRHVNIHALIGVIKVRFKKKKTHEGSTLLKRKTNSLNKPTICTSWWKPHTRTLVRNVMNTRVLPWHSNNCDAWIWDIGKVPAYVPDKYGKWPIYFWTSWGLWNRQNRVVVKKLMYAFLTDLRGSSCHSHYQNSAEGLLYSVAT